MRQMRDRNNARSSAGVLMKDSKAPPAVSQPLISKEAEVLICFSHLRWSFVYQRPQHLLSRAAADRLVYFFEEPLEQEGLTAPHLDVAPQQSGVVVLTPRFPADFPADDAIEVQQGYLDEVLARHASATTIFWYYTPMALRFSAHHAPDLCVYDCMDQLSAFRGAPVELTRLEDTLFRRADLVFTGGQSLYEVKRARHANVYAFPSSIDSAHFTTARRRALRQPPDQRQLPRPRIGFFGVIDERMDTALVGTLARLRPDWQFVMLGPVVKIDPADLPHEPNLHWLGAKSYDDLPGYLEGWDAGFMPFAINESTRFISPTKTPEFLAAGVPVVSTRIRDVQRPYGDLGLVQIADTAEGFVAALEKALSMPRQPWLKAVDGFLVDMSWSRTWGSMNELMQAALLQSDVLLAATQPSSQQEVAHV
jgi:UDP-galactopyranose mutase